MRFRAAFCRAVIPLLLAAILHRPGDAQTLPGYFRHERAVTPGGTGPNRLPVDVPLLVGAQPLRYVVTGTSAGQALALTGGLEDLRLYDPSGREVGYLLIPSRAPSERWQDGRILPVLATEEESGFEVDLGSALRVDAVRLENIPPPFLKRVRLEGSGDRSHWSVLVADGTLFDLPSELLKRTELTFNPGAFQYFRITWNDRNSAPVPPPQAVVARVVASISSAPAVSVPISFERRASEPGKSRFRLHLPGAQLPVTAIELNCAGAYLLREARISEPRLFENEVVPIPLGSGTLRRMLRGDLVAADLRIPITRPQGPDLDLVVDDANNPPLELLTVSVELAPPPWIYFDSSGGESLTARFGNPTLAAPRYDLEAVRESLSGVLLAEAQWGEVRDLAPPPTEGPGSSQLPATGAAIDPTTFRYARPILRGVTGLTALVLDAAVLAHSDLQDLRITDRDGYQVPYVLERLEEPLSVDLDALQAVATKSGSANPSESHYRLVLPHDSLPASRLVLTTTGRVFERRFSVTVERQPVDARSKPRVATVVSGTWRHTDPDTPAAPLVLSLPRLGVSTADLVIDEGDNSPLPLLRPRLLLPAYRLRFFRISEDELTLLYGQPSLGSPRYDLALLAPRVLGAPAHEVSPARESSAASVAPKLGTNVQTRLFWGALIAAVLVLVALIVRLVAKGESRTG